MFRGPPGVSGPREEGQQAGGEGFAVLTVCCLYVRLRGDQVLRTFVLSKTSSASQSFSSHSLAIISLGVDMRLHSGQWHMAVVSWGTSGESCISVWVDGDHLVMQKMLDQEDGKHLGPQRCPSWTSDIENPKAAPSQDFPAYVEMINGFTITKKKKKKKKKT